MKRLLVVSVFAVAILFVSGCQTKTRTATPESSLALRPPVLRLTPSQPSTPCPSCPTCPAVPRLVLPPIELKSPVSGTSLVGWTLRLVWQPIELLGPDWYYEVLVDKGSGLKPIAYVKSDYHEIGWRELPNGTYKWSIRVVDKPGYKQITRDATPWALKWQSRASYESDPCSGEDKDGDGYFAGPGGTGCDCDDADPEIHPGAFDPSKDGIDWDCDGRD